MKRILLIATLFWVGCKSPTPANHKVYWLALSAGELLVPDMVEVGELAIFEPSNQPINIYAKTDADFVLGSVAAHTIPLNSLGAGQVPILSQVSS